MDARDTDTNIDKFVPKCEIRQQIGLVANFLFCYFLRIQINKNKLVNNN